MSQIMTELAGKWKGFTDEQKAGISEAVAGKQQAAVFQSLMQNFDVFKKAQRELNSGDAFGSMAKENEAFVNSISGQLNKLKEIWIGVFQDLFNPRMFGGLLQGAIVVSQFIATVIDALDNMGALTPILAMLGVAISAKMITGFTGLGVVLGGVTRSLGLFGAASASAGAFIGPPTAAAALFSSTLATLGASILPILAVGAALGLAAIAFNHFTESTAEADVRLNKTISNRKNEIKTIDSQIGKLKEVQKEYDSLVGKPNKTAEEVERLAKATNKIAEIKPELVSGYDKDGNAILSMTGDVEDLIKKMNEAKEVKERLLLGDREEKGKNAIKKNAGGQSGTGGLLADSLAGGGQTGLEKSTEAHVSKIESLEKKRDAALAKMYLTTGEERKKSLEKVTKANDAIEKEQNEFNGKFTKQVSDLKKISREIGDGLFAGVEKGANFRAAGDGVQKRFTELKKSLDFSDITTEEQGAKVEATLGKLVLQADKGKLHIGNLKKSIEEANSEFSKSGDVDKYNKTISDLVNGIEGMSKVDKENLTNLFTGIDESALQGTDGLDKFLKAYNSSADELANNNSFAQALAAQKAALDNGFNSINEALSSDDLEVHKQVRVALQSDQDLPAELRDMIRVLSNTNASDADVLRFAQKVMVDISEGDLNIESANREIEQKFGKGVFEITPEILMSDGARIAGIENIKKQITDKLDDIPIEKEIKVDVATAVANGNINDIISALDKVPEEKRSEVIAKVGKALEEIGTVEAIELAKKVVNIGADGKDAKGIISGINKTPMQKKTTKISENGGKGVKGNLDNINKTSMKTKTTKISQTGGSGVLGMINSIMNKPSVKTITTKFLSIFSSSGGGGSKKSGTTGAGNVSKPGLVSTVSSPIAPMSPSPSVAPMSTGSVGTASAPSSSPAPMSTGATSSSNMNIGNIMPSFDFNVDMLRGMESELKKINNQLEILDKKSKDAFGEDKIYYINQQNNLYREQQRIQHELAESMRKQQNELRYMLSMKEFTFDYDGNVINDSEKLLEKERYVKSLEEKVSADKEGTNEGLKKHYEEAKAELESSKQYLNEYIELTNTGIPECSNQWLELQQKIEESNLEILKAKDELSNLRVEIKIDKFEVQVKKVQNEIKRLDTQIQNAFGTDKQALIDKKVDALRREQDELHKLANSYREQAKLKSDLLTSQGFIIEADGDIANEELLESFRGTALFDYLQENIKSYNDLVNDKIPGLGDSWWSLEDSIKDSYKEQLKVAKEMQDKVTEVYKKNLDEKKKLIDKELSLKVEALNKEKEAYNANRKEQDFKNDYQDQKDVIDELNSKISNASKDNSIIGQKRLRDLVKQMEEEQKKLEELNQSRIDESVNSMYDKESDRLKEDADRVKENLDNVYSDENIQKLVNGAISTGVFTDIDGNIRTLQSTMMEFEDKFGDGMSAMGGIVKSDLITNLELAREALKDMGDISNALGLSKISSYNSIAIPSTMSSVSPVTNQNVTVQFNQPLISVQGNVTQDVVPQLEQMIKEAQKQITENIVKKIK